MTSCPKDTLSKVTKKRKMFTTSKSTIQSDSDELAKVL